MIKHSQRVVHWIERDVNRIIQAGTENKEEEKKETRDSRKAEH